MWSNPSLGYLIEYINGELSQDIFTINDQSGMVNIIPNFDIENLSQRIKYLLGSTKIIKLNLNQVMGHLIFLLGIVEHKSLQ
jgi:hypothetical protein